MKGLRVELTLALDSNSKKSLQAQIFDQIRALILSGRLQADMALPPTRALAERFRVSRNTVMIAYERLAAEGYVEARGTAGVFVTSIPPDDLLLISSVSDDARSNGHWTCGLGGRQRADSRCGPGAAS
jgi:GntR family transcriptional regulator/MocR family aminotransferase